ncbi:MAG: argininosuccinate synthase [Planctomycetes bacterium]|nr:argininosuccinate synthase [Planctomycetota bacterium]MCA8936808.1 argininosuccinate synthase [Planctomycetota bacterium]MCA8945150.1 argininosuccinate synthase [Planctomycetota bacterium]
MEKVVMAYSGGLDTTAALHWLKRVRGMKVVALALNIGQGGDFDEVAERAIDAGADSVHAIDRRRTFVKQYCFKALKASARYENSYYLSAALSRPLIATELVALAREEGARFVAHGAPPKGNDQFRFECAVAALDPNLEMIAPMREWGLKTRGEVTDYLKQNKLPVGEESARTYSSDRNIWGVRSSAGELEDPAVPAPDYIFQITAPPEKAPDEPEELEIKFHQGEPVALNGKRYQAVEMVEALNEIAGRHGVGRIDTVEDRILGFKSREVYEAPAAHVLSIAHEELEKLTLDAEFVEFKPLLSARYARLVYDSQWFTKLRESLDAFFRESQQYVTGTVKIKLFKGAVHVLGRNSEFSIYDREASRRHQLGGIPAASVAGYLELRRLNQMTHAFKQRPKF